MRALLIPLLAAASLAAAPLQAREPVREIKAPAKVIPAPALALRDLRGEVRRLEDYRGKVVLVNFWASWCEPCLAEMPSLEDLERRLASRSFAVLAVNFAESEERIEAYLNNYGIKLDVLLDKDMGASRRWSARILPASFVVDATGIVRYSVLGEADWTAPGIVAAIEKLLPK
jgi:thiol-disulfide isomerase/thioredoxin